MTDATVRGPLTGFRALELANVIAGPFTGALLAELGADLIKIELPTAGDGMRGLAPIYAGHSLYWASMGRNKRAITLDIRTPRGRELLLDLVKQSDVVIENFRPGTMERWNLGYEVLKEANPDVVLVRISGYGQDGPYSEKAGFGTPATAISGLTYLLGFPDRPPITLPVSLADYLAGMFGALSALAGIVERQKNGRGGQWVDISLYESVFRLLEAVIPRYEKLGEVPERLGDRTGQSFPIGTFATGDHKYVVISSSTDRTWRRMVEAMGKAALADDPRFLTNGDRVRHADELSPIIAGWFLEHTQAEALEILDAVGLPICPVNSMADIYADPHFQARGDILNLDDPEIGPVPMPAAVPRFSRTPAEVRYPGPALGAHNAEVYTELLGLDAAAQEQLKAEGVI